MLYAPINLVYAVFSGVMIFLTAYRNLTLSALHVVITLTFPYHHLCSARFHQRTAAGMGTYHRWIDCLYHAVGSLTQAFTGHAILPLGPLLFHKSKSLHSIAKVV